MTNTASAEGTLSGAPVLVRSNTVADRIDELLDLALAGPAQFPVGAAAVAVPVTLTNAGNGPEAFDVTAAVTGTAHGVAIDRDRDGRFDPAVDTRLDGVTPPLAPGEELALLVLDVDRVSIGARLVVTARADTGSGTPGTLFAGRGEGGGDALVGLTTAEARLELMLVDASAGAGGATLTKAQAVRAPDGGASPVAGAVVTYTLTADFPAAGARAARVVDPLPAGTAYRAGSLRLDGALLSDAADADPGTVADGIVTVLLGDVTTPGLRTVEFQVTIQ